MGVTYEDQLLVASKDRNVKLYDLAINDVTDWPKLKHHHHFPAHGFLKLSNGTEVMIVAGGGGFACDYRAVSAPLTQGWNTCTSLPFLFSVSSHSSII